MSRDQWLGLPNVISATPLEGTDRYQVYFSNPDPRDSSRLAQQLLTTVGTLVVAVAGFYFGSAATARTDAFGNGGRAAVSATGAAPLAPSNGEPAAVSENGELPEVPGAGMPAPQVASFDPATGHLAPEPIRFTILGQNFRPSPTIQLVR